ncbi:MAG: cytochrome c [Chromatiaceae bacterium]|jgi:cytochrome c556|nr:cytochrome c [Chromatiaceae bacterium]
MKKVLVLGVIALSLATTAVAQVKPEDQIKIRQAGYSFMSWNMGKIKTNLEGQFDAKQVEAAANAIAGIANSGMGALYGPGTDKDIGSVKTRVKPELFENKAEVGKVAKDFIAAANNLSKVAASGDKAAVQKAFGDMGAACKACHEKFRME